MINNEILQAIVDNEFYQSIFFFGFINGALFMLVLTGTTSLVESVYHYFKNRADKKNGK